MIGKTRRLWKVQKRCGLFSQIEPSNTVGKILMCIIKAESMDFSSLRPTDRASIRKGLPPLMRIKSFGVCWALGVATVLSCMVRGDVGPFVNGSFEDPVVAAGGHEVPVGSTNVTGWVRGGPGQMSIVNGSAAGLVDPADGVQQMDFNSGNSVPGGTLAQEFLTAIGQTYTVSFQVARIGPGGGTMGMLAEMTSGTGSLLGSKNVVLPNTPGYGAAETFTFTATSTNSTLKFTDTSLATDAVDVLLDNVRVGVGTGVCVPPPSGLVSWWPGNGNATDVVGNNQGTLSGGASYVAGEVGQAFSFDGVDDQASFGNTVGNFDTNDFTVEFWLKTTSSRHEAVIEKMPSCGYSSLWTIWIGGAAPWSGPGRLEAQTFSDSSGGDANSISAGRPINDGLFHHVALVRRGTNLLFYIDGAADVAVSSLSGTVSRINNAANLVAGVSACGGSGILPFTGQMDEPAVYDRALSEAEIQAIYQAGSAGKCAPPSPPAKALAHWKFDETSGTTAQDSAGTYNGQLSPGGASFVPGGVSGGALSLAKSNNGFVNIGNVLGLTSGDYSIVSWIKMTAGDTTESSVIIAKHAAYTRNGYNLMVNKSGGLLRENKVAFVEGGDGVGQITIDETPISTTSVNDGNWHQVVAVYQAGGTKLIYVDGAPAEDAKPSQAFNANSVPLLIGGVNFGGVPTGLFTGLIDEVQIYNYALADADVSFLFQNPGQQIPPHDLVPGNWRLNTAATLGGSITRNPDLPEFGSGTNVTLTAVAAPGFAFAAWSGSASGTNNPLTITMDGNKTVTAGFTDVAPPAITITSPVGGTLSEDAFTLGGTVTDNVAVESARWEWNGQPVGPLVMTGGSFSVGGLRLYQGENRLKVIGRDASGNEGFTEVIVTWHPQARALARWSFDETSGTTAHDSAGTYNGTLSAAGAEFVTNGVAGGAIRLNRSANGFVNMGNVLGLENTDFSLVAWVKMAAGDTANSLLLSKHAAYSRNGYSIIVNSTGTGVPNNKAAFIEGGSGLAAYTAEETPYSTTSVNDGSWHQIVAVYQVGGSKLIYVDGAPAEDSKPSVAFLQNTAVFLIGGADFDGVPTSVFDGLIDEVQIYNYALTGAEVDFLFANPAQVIAEHDLPVGWSLNTTVAGNGTVQRSPDLARYPAGTNVTLTAVAATGFAFSGWSGDATGTVNPLTVTMNGNKTILANFSDSTPPVVTITSPAGGTNADERFTLSGSVSDNVGVASARWEWNGRAIEPLTLSGGQFSVNSLKLKAGENRIRVLALDAAGNEASNEVLVTWAPARTLAVVNPPASQEGTEITVPVRLISSGGVGGMSFRLRYDAEYLTAPELAWSPVAGSALNQVNIGTSGQIQATFALPATEIPAGTQTVATVTFRARSVPVSLNTDLSLDILDASAPTGNPIASGSVAQSGSARILVRRVIGDNNATDTLDVGDSAIILRLLTGLDPVRAWDITGNDVNASSTLDSGDVIRVLRAVVGLDPQPSVGGFGPLGGKPKPGLRGAGFTGAASLSLDKTRAQPGELVTLQVRLDGVTTPVSGTSLTVEYPTNALRLINPLSYRPGAMVPGSAVALWNLAPAQTNFAAQTGRLSFGASSGISWPTNNGVVAELVFQAQPGQAAQYLWPIRLTGGAVASEDGFELSSLLNASINYIGRDQNPSTFDGASIAYTANGLELTLAGEAGLSYLIEKSSDLVNWTPLKVVNGANGTVTFVDGDALNNPKRFYRAKSQ